MANDAKDKCAKCGKTRAQIEKEIAEAEKKGVHVYQIGDVLKYCKNCEKSFCGSCQVDLGWQGSGCPVCGEPLVG